MISKRYIGGILAVALAYYLSSRNNYYRKKEGKTVTTKSGSLKGIISLSRDGREFYEWLGVPYAKPPVGPLRFATPQPLDTKWDVVLGATDYGSTCAQFSIFTGKVEGTEDCLFLNVHVPKIEDTKKLLPVMFWIHGGYFMVGSSGQYQPHYFMDEDVVLVTINYRLAALPWVFTGFLNTGDAASRGNMGLKDQSLALRWVKENIVHFGGDPNKITIFGESAGGGATDFHMLSPMSHGLMHRAISQSGAVYCLWALNDDPVGQAKSFAAKFNCPTDSTVKMIECLRNVPANELVSVHSEIMGGTHTKDMVYVPTVETIVDEETFLPAHPTTLLNSGKIAKIPLLTGFTADDGLVTAVYIHTNKEYRTRLHTETDFFADVSLELNDLEKKSVDKIKEYFYGKTEGIDFVEQYDETVKLMTDRWFAYGVYKSALAHAKHAPVQMYVYNKTGPSLYDYAILIKGKFPAIVEVLYGLSKNWFNEVVLGKPPVSYGVSHADDIAMLFENGLDVFHVPKGDRNYEFSRDLVKTWVSYASVANVEDVAFRGVKFPFFDPKIGPIVTVINDVPEVRTFPTLERNRFWESLGF